jgi:hypothetical protein
VPTGDDRPALQYRVVGGGYDRRLVCSDWPSDDSLPAPQERAAQQFHFLKNLCGGRPDGVVALSARARPSEIPATTSRCTTVTATRFTRGDVLVGQGGPTSAASVWR